MQCAVSHPVRQELLPQHSLPLQEDDTLAEEESLQL
jgi:hypothetical protein